MAKSKKSKPSFDRPAAKPAAASTPVDTGWVYRSDGPAPVVVAGPAAIPTVPVPSSALVRQAPLVAAPSPAWLTADRVAGWLTLPFEVALVVALLPFRSK
jgi:hypothetical protein